MGGRRAISLCCNLHSNRRKGRRTLRENTSISTRSKKVHGPPSQERNHFKTQALSRAKAKEKSLIIRKPTWHLFQNMLQEYLDLGYAQPVSATDYQKSTSCYVMPGYAADKDSRSTTTARSVSLYHNLRTILSKDSLQLRKWRSSFSDVSEIIPTEYQEVLPIQDSVDRCAASHPKALGVTNHLKKSIRGGEKNSAYLTQ